MYVIVDFSLMLIFQWIVFNNFFEYLYILSIFIRAFRKFYSHTLPHLTDIFEIVLNVCSYSDCQENECMNFATSVARRQQYCICTCSRCSCSNSEPRCWKNDLRSSRRLQVIDCVTEWVYDWFITCSKSLIIINQSLHFVSRRRLYFLFVLNRKAVKYYFLLLILVCLYLNANHQQ